MGQHEEKIEIIKKYAPRISTIYPFHIKGDIPSKKIDTAIEKFAKDLKRETIIGFYDTSLFGNGKCGYIFTDEKVYSYETLEKPKKMWYSDIKNVEIIPKFKKDCDDNLKFDLYDGSVVEWAGITINKSALKDFFDEILAFDNNEEESKPYFENGDNGGAVAAGVAAGTYGTVNKSFDEEKFHASRGHGFAAERANDLFDKATGHNAHIVGDNNAKNGADRIVDGIEIQSKYCKTGSKCINECFENEGKGYFRYINSHGKPMQIEVPSDKYESAVQAMQEKIRRGQVKGITNPEDAKNIVRKGHFTYKQACNIAKAGTVESLTYDAVNGAIIASSALGVTALLTFATSIWNGEDFDIALKTATFSGLKVGGTAFAATIISGQLSKAGLNSALVGSSEAIVSLMGPKASAILVNAFRSGSNIYGAAAMKSAAKLLRGNVITSAATVVILSSFDIANIFRGRISGKQLFKNLANTTSTVAGGAGGWLGGAAIGSAILPGIGTVVGGLIGSFAAGSVASKASNMVLGNFIEDDAEEMVQIIEKTFASLSNDYLLSQKEAEKIADKLGEKLGGSSLKDMYASDNRTEFANNLLIPIIECEVSQRHIIKVPSNDELNNSLKSILEDIADNNISMA